MASGPIGQWLRRRFVAGFFVTVPLVISIAALVWIFGIIDDFTAPLATRLVGRAAPGVGILIMLLFVLAVGTVATNVIGRRILGRAEQWLARVPVFKTIYSPVRQLVAAFSPDNEYGFKRVVMVEDERRGLVMGFLTKEFTVELVVSQELIDRAGLDLAAYEHHDVEIRGRQERLAVRAIKQARELTAMS